MQEKQQTLARGIIVYIRNSLVTSDTLIFQSKDDIICVKISGVSLSISHDLYVCLCYVIPDDSSRQSMIDNNTFDRLLDFITSIHSKDEHFDILLCGDMNARTSTNPDYVIDDNLLHMSMLPDDYLVDTVLPRFSQDYGRTNNNGSLLLDLCKQTGLRIFNGRVGDDSDKGKCTFVGHNGTSLVDYFIGSPHLFKCIDSFKVHDPNILSDHCLLEATFTFDALSNIIHNENTNLDSCFVTRKFVWKNESKHLFLDSISKQAFQEELTKLNYNINAANSNVEIDNCVNDISGLLSDVCTPLFNKNTKIFTQDENIKYSDNRWFTEECYQKKLLFHRYLNIYRLHN